MCIRMCQLSVTGLQLASGFRKGYKGHLIRSTGRRSFAFIKAIATDAAVIEKPAVKEKYFGYAAIKPKTDLEPFTYEPAELKPDEIELEVTHNGLCHTDLHMKDDDWGISKFPFIPGHEVVGNIIRVGSLVTEYKVGQRVGVGWIRDSCRQCTHCLKGQENICFSGYTGLIVGGNFGGFQKIMRAPADFAYKIPEALDSVSAAPLLCAGVTVYAPLRRHVFPSANVCILGVGGLGHLAIQFAAKMGAQVTAIDSSSDKEAEAKSLGADKFVTFQDATAPTNSSKQNLLGSFDLILNCVSGKIDTATLMSLLRQNGALVQIGIPASNPLVSVPLNDLVFNQKKLEGSIVGGRADMVEMLELAAAKGIKPLTEIYPLSKVNEGIVRVASGKARYRVVLVTD